MCYSLDVISTRCGRLSKASASEAVTLDYEKGVSPFSRRVIFTRARVSLALLSLRKNRDYSQSSVTLIQSARPIFLQSLHCQRSKKLVKKHLQKNTYCCGLQTFSITNELSQFLPLPDGMQFSAYSTFCGSSGSSGSPGSFESLDCSSLFS